MTMNDLTVFINARYFLIICVALHIILATYPMPQSEIHIGDRKSLTMSNPSNWLLFSRCFEDFL